MKDTAIMIVPNTKDGLAAVKYLANEITEHGILVKLVTKKEFDIVVKGDK
jgi:hypothetical protein